MEYWTESVWFTFAVWIFAQNIITSDRNFRFSRPGLTDDQLSKIVEVTRNLGPVRFFDVRVLLYAALLALPIWLFYPFRGTTVHDCLVVISLGAFMAPFALRSSSDPEAEDLRRPYLFIKKLLLGKCDAWVKTLFLVGITSVIAMIPGLRQLGIFYTRNVLGVVNGPQHELFEHLLTGTLAPFAVMVCLRISALGIYGLWRLCLFTVAIAFVWVNYQWFANVAWVSRNPIAKIILEATPVAFLLDVIKDVALTFISGPQNHYGSLTDKERLGGWKRLPSLFAALTRALKRLPPLFVALMWTLIPSIAALFLACRIRDVELRKIVWTGAITLFFGGFLGGMLKVLLDEVAAAKRLREDAAGFVTNILADLKSVYDRVARARILIPAHKSVKTYGDEMRDMIEARVQLRNITRALERRAEGVDEKARREVIGKVRQMEEYLATLTSEFSQKYKPLSDKQRGYEERAKAMLKRFAETETQGDPPELPSFVWESISTLDKLSDFVGEAHKYKSQFEDPLDDSSELLRNELTRILGVADREHKSPGPKTSPFSDQIN